MGVGEGVGLGLGVGVGVGVGVGTLVVRTKEEEIGRRGNSPHRLASHGMRSFQYIDLF